MLVREFVGDVATVVLMRACSEALLLMQPVGCLLWQCVAVHSLVY
jgi:hypothetical protein